MKIPLTLSFKGERVYLQGGDFYISLLEEGAKITGNSTFYIERLTFRRFTKKECFVTTVKPTGVIEAVGQVKFRLPNNSTFINAWIVETEACVMSKRKFDEDLVLSKAAFNKKTRTAELITRSIYTPIEDVIAITKFLNNSVSPLEQGQGQWVFGQLDLTGPLEENYTILNIQMKSLIDNRFSVNDILIDGRRIGSIRFIVGTP
jgi:hypothetical protein